MPNESVKPAQTDRKDAALSAPTISLPKGGGAIRGIGEKFAANPVTGTGSMSVPIAVSPGRAGFGPQLSLNYDSGSGNGPFGLGWSLSLPSIRRKTDKGLPRYDDSEESDVFMLSGAEDLVPVLAAGARLVETARLGGSEYEVHLYRPRIEGTFARIERWRNVEDPTDSFWRSIDRANVSTWYGLDPESRIFDPKRPERIFEWLVSQNHDDKGNVAEYLYVAEDSRSIDPTTCAESNRSPAQRTSQRYLQLIRYGNRAPYLPTLDPALAQREMPSSDPDNWMFEVVLDYGDHPELTRNPSAAWGVRLDPFSTYRPGFEIRTYRLCRRILMFHHFPEAAGVGRDCLVCSTDFDYALPDSLNSFSQPSYTVLQSATRRHYQRTPDSDGLYEAAQFPPVSFTYSEAVVDPTVRTIDPAQLENLPVGVQGPGYQWIDLDGEGLCGVLSEQSGAWYYKPNRGSGIAGPQFGPQRVVSPLPSMALAPGSRHQLLDLDGSGRIDVVDFGGATPGFYQREVDIGWRSHVSFQKLPNIDWQDPNLRFVDLTGDGHADALITEQDVFTWYPSLDVRGFDTAQRACQPTDENAGPKLVFADNTQTIFLADMSGDGLTDLVRVRNGEICYWPNQGYGIFGRKVTLDNSPRFDTPDQFDPRRIRLTDIDGSGTADVIYLGRSGACLYFNRSGNSVSDPLVVPLPIASENLAAVQVADLLGNGTACLVWNSSLPADAGHCVLYVRLMGSGAGSFDCHDGKPHLLIGVDNNLGASTQIEYTPSTQFYLQDRAAGMPWATRLPFPVHCVSRVTVRDQWRGTAFSSTYSYHHGHFDGVEREFRGFGRVEQVDAEDYSSFLSRNQDNATVTDDPTLFQPPVKTVTWYHTGLADDRHRILALFEEEYFPQQFAKAISLDPAGFREKFLPDPEISSDLTGDEWREALRACKGMVLRQEVYELDAALLEGPSRLQVPVRLFSAAIHNCHIQLIQPKAFNLHAVFMVSESEALSYQYELSLLQNNGEPLTVLSPDPRISHTLNLRHDELGNPVQSVTVGYGRWRVGDYAGLPRPDLIADVQAEEHIAYTESRYTLDLVVRATDAIQSPVRHHRLRLPCETLTYELAGISKKDCCYYSIEDFASLDLSEVYGHQSGETAPLTTVQFLPYHQIPDGSAAQRRLVQHGCTAYFDDASDTASPFAPLPFGQHGPRGLKYEDYKLALTQGLLQAIFAQPDSSGAVDDKLGWETPPSVADPVRTARDLLDDASVSGYARGEDLAARFAPLIEPESLAGQHWMRSGSAGFVPSAPQHFFLPKRYTDPFGNVTTLEFDGMDLFPVRTVDALGNTVSIALDSTSLPRFDYRVLAPLEMVDVNGNHSEVLFDRLAHVVATALKGKQDAFGVWQGDCLDGFNDALANLSSGDVAAFSGANTLDEDQARAWLGSASTRMVYHFGDALDGKGSPVWGTAPPVVCTIAREIHAAQPGGLTSPLQVGLEISDGAGQVLMKKQQAEPALGEADLRWIVNGLTVLNNKGKPVRQYEPAFFEQGFGSEAPQANGVSATVIYDAVGRLVRSEFPDGTLSRVVFSPWDVETWDQNDTVLESQWYRDQNAPDPSLPLPIDPITQTVLATPAQRAAWLTARHALTPARTLIDSLGREVIAIAHNRVQDSDGALQFAGAPWRDEFLLTFTKLDAEGKPLWIRDARGNLVMDYVTPAKATRLADDPSEEIPRHSDPSTGALVSSAPCYDIAGNLLFQRSMDAGDRWTLVDAAGKPFLSWDFNTRRLGSGTTANEKRLFRTQYDALHRPTGQWLQVNDTTALLDVFEYLDTQGLSGADLLDAQSRNRIGQAIRHWDPSGLQTIERIDLSGQPSHITRTLILVAPAQDDVPAVNWDIPERAVLLEPDIFIQRTEHDALGRPTLLYNWHRDLTYAPDGTQQVTPGQTNRVSLIVPQYNQRGSLQSEALYLHASKTTRPDGSCVGDISNANSSTPIQSISYNAKGQKLALSLGNGTTTQYIYDPNTFRLLTLRTTRFSPVSNVQDLQYTYDPIGNITRIQDNAQDTLFFRNQIVEPSADYTFDALYRLTEATGRENAAAMAPPAVDEGPWPSGGMPSPNALRRYTQRYAYDEVGNFASMQHLAAAGGWTRQYDTQLDSNRLQRTWYGTGTWDQTLPQQRTQYSHDPHGNMLGLVLTAADGGQDIRWDWRDMIHSYDCIGGGVARYHYDMGKQRTRKHITRNAGAIEDRIYLGSYELYRRYLPGDFATPVEEIESLHLEADKTRILLVDDVLVAKSSAQPGPSGLAVAQQILFRYQYSNHLGSVALELDGQAQIISYEEYHPYGTSAYRLMNAAVEAPAKRYRYTGMERDEESGLNYHSARYYAQWLGRWMSADPAGSTGGTDLYTYASGSPTRLVDGTGMAPQVPSTTTKGLYLLQSLKDLNITDRTLLANVANLASQGMLIRQDARGHTLAETLLDLARHSVQEGLKDGNGSQATMVTVLRSISDDILHPEEMNYVGSGCTAKAIGYFLATTNPTGYAAIVGELATAGSAVGPGGLIKLDSTALENGPNEGRSLASRLFQSSLMHTAIPGYQQADKNMVADRGFDYNEFKTAMTLVGENVTTGEFMTIPGEAVAIRSLPAIQACLPAVVGLNWPSASAPGDWWLTGLVAKLFPNGHAVVVTRIEEGRVFFVDPGNLASAGQSIGPSQPGNRDGGPDRRTEGHGVFSMQLDDFSSLAKYYGTINPACATPKGLSQ
jgi:RHS repeat-associated protein